ncbi:MAG TPA: peptidoglycan recognition family protein, partial [Thermoleophilia bacterium]
GLAYIGLSPAASRDARAAEGGPPFPAYTLRMAPLTRIALAAAAALALCESLSAALLLGAALVAPAPAGASTASALRPPITVKLIPFGATRKAQMADYSRRHYHQHTYLLTNPKVVVLHHTAGATWQPAWWTFASNTAYASIPGRPEKPGVSAHFIIDKDGTIFQCVPLSVRARHAIGMNWKSFGIEFVQEPRSGKDGHWMDQQILNRTKQVRAGLRLVRYLRARFGIKTSDVVGHATANASRYFKEYAGIKNAAGDWFAPEVKAFRARL